MTFPHETQVLVIGAGPVGLAAAIALIQLGIKVTIVDASSTLHKGARASIVHSRTLEVLETINLAKPLIDKGTPADHFTIRGATDELLAVDFTLLKHDTQFPFTVLISQELIEKIFADEFNKIGGTVHLNKKAISIQPIDAASDNVKVSFDDGTSIVTSYIIGADGIDSLVRTTAGISFTDPFTGKLYDDPNTTYELVVILSDLFLEEPLPEKISRNALTVHLDNFFFLLPLQSVDDRGPFWRVVINFPLNAEVPKNPSKEDMQKLINERNPWPTPITVSSIISASRYRVRVAQADRYHSTIGNTNILLAGDAAHMHSPAGGQGMNLGICDAVAAAQAIHAHIHSASPKRERDEIFTAYSSRRHIVGRRVIGTTKGLTIMVTSNRGWKRLIRNAVFFILNRFTFVKRAFVWRVSGLVNRDT